MRIGLIGINRYAKLLNFACDLHVYAFQQYLAQQGYESTILDYKPAYYRDFDMRHPAPYAEARYREALTRRARTPEQVEARERALEKWAELAMGYRSTVVERERRHDKFEAFITEHLTFTEEEYDSDLLEVQDPGFDCYVCVTDVIWQTISVHGFDRGFLLGSKAFEGKQKIAYAASRGTTGDLDGPRAEQFFGYLRDIGAISVREQDFATYIEQHSELSAQTVLDPVLLHDREFWHELAVPPRQERYVLLYYVMEQAADTIDKAVEYAKRHDLTLVELSDRPLKHGRVTDPDVKHVTRYDVGMEEWLGYLEHADAVFTNSFHGCCFAVLFERSFFVGRRDEQKVPAFLASLGLDDRRFEPDTDVDDLSPDIDYAAVRRILEARRQQSADFILTALKDAEQRVASGSLPDVSSPDASAHEARRRALAYPVRFHSGRVGTTTTIVDDVVAEGGQVKRLKSRALEYRDPEARYRNDGTAVVGSSPFRAAGHEFAGWTMRFRIDNRWFWSLDDGTVAPGDVAGADLESRKVVLVPGDVVPHLPVNHVGVVVFVARWRERPPEAPAPPTTPAAASVARKSFLKRVALRARGTP